MKIIRVRISLFIILLLANLSLHAQGYNLRHYSEKDGLLTSEIKQIAFDKLNTMYIVTQYNRLWTFNGTQFREYPLNAGGEVNIYIEMDNEKNVWLIREDYGKPLVTVDKLAINSFPSPGPQSFKFAYYPPINQIKILTHKEQSRVFFLTPDSVVGGVIGPNEELTKLSGNLSVKYLENTDSALLLITNDSIYKLDIIGQKKRTKAIFGRAKKLIYLREEDKYLIITNSHLLLYNNRFKLLKVNAIPFVFAEKAQISNLKYVYVNSELYMFNAAQCYKLNLAITEIAAIDEKNGFLNSQISDIKGDLQGNVWFAHDLGITLVSGFAIQNQTPFELFQKPAVSAITWLNEKKKYLFLGSNNGYAILDLLQKKIVLTKEMPYVDTVQKYTYQSLRILDAVTYENSVYAAWKKIGLIRVTEVNGRFKEDLIPLKNVEMHLLASVLCIDNTLYIGFHNTIVVYDLLAKREVKRYSLRNDKFIVRKIFRRDKNVLLIAGIGGLWELNTGNGLSVVFAKNQSFYSYLKLKYNRGELIGSNAGLFQLNKYGVSKTYLTTKSAIYALAEDKLGKIWIGTNDGVTIWNMGYNAIRELGPLNGLLGLEVNRSAFLVDSNYIYIGTNKGLNTLGTQFEIKRNPVPIFISSMLVNGAVVTKNSEVFPYASNIIVNLGFNNYNSWSNLTYKYKIIGESRDWVESKSPQLNFSKLGSGNYTIEFVVSNGNNEISNRLILDFGIATPWWQSVWYYLVFVGLLVLSFVVVYRFRIKQMEKENLAYKDILNLKKQVAEANMSALRAQINPHFVSNVLNRIRYYVLAKKNERAFDLITDYAHLMRFTFANTNADFVKIKDELDFYERIIRLESESGIDCSIQVSEEAESIIENNYMPSMLVQPAIENAIKHGVPVKKVKQKVTLSLQKENDQLVFRVVDNGGGFNLEDIKSNTSGITVTQSRIDYYNRMNKGSFTMKYYKNPDGIGTLVEIRIPILPLSTITKHPTPMPQKGK